MRGNFGVILIIMHAVLWVGTYAATRRAYRLRAQHPQRYQRSTWARCLAGVFRSPRHAAQLGAGITGGTAIGAASATIIRRVFATSETQSVALFGLIVILLVATWAYVQWRKRQQHGTLR